MCKFCPHIYTTWEPGDQKRRMNPLELELPASVSCAEWVLGIEPGLSGRAASILSYWAISLAHTLCVCVSRGMNVQKSESGFGEYILSYEMGSWRWNSVPWPTELSQQHTDQCFKSSSHLSSRHRLLAPVPEYTLLVLLIFQDPNIVSPELSS